MALEILPPTPNPFQEASDRTFAGVPALLGIPYGEGHEEAANVIRQASLGLDSYSPLVDQDLGETRFTDYGSLVLKDQSREEAARLVGDAARAIHGTEAVPIFIGGDGSLGPAAVRATLDRFPDLHVLQASASPLLLDEVSGDKWHPGCAGARVLDRLPGDQLLLLGVRRGSRSEFSEMKADQRIVTRDDLQERVGESGIYLNLRLDVFDPSLVPAAGSLEPGGWFWQDFEALISRLPWDQVRAVEISGLIPAQDVSAYSSLLAAKAVREIILSLPRIT